jgi:acylphosphatase
MSKIGGSRSRRGLKKTVLETGVVSRQNLLMTCRRVIFEGRVQGVGFRYATKDLARGYDVTGTVRNLPEGTVELIVAGEAEEVAEFLRDLREDSGVAHHIKSFTEDEIAPLPDLKGFSIVA